MMDSTAKKQAGVAALEVALVLVPLLLLVFVIGSLGFYFLIQQRLSHAAGEGARALVAASMRQEANPGARACAAAWATLDSATGWMGPTTLATCEVVAHCGSQVSGTCLAHLSVDFPNKNSLPVLPMLESLVGLFGMSESVDGQGRLATLIGSRVTAQVVAPVSDYKGQASMGALVR